MTRHIEWAGVEDCAINFGRADEEGCHVLVLGDDPAFAIEAERPEQFVEFARTLLSMAHSFQRSIDPPGVEL